MADPDSQNTQRLRLNNHLRLIEDLWQKLYYVKWNAKSFAMLARLAQDLANNAPAQSDENTAKIALQLEQHVKTCLALNGPPRESERQRLTALIDALRYQVLTLHDPVTGTVNAPIVDDEPRTRRISAPLPEIFLIAPGEKPLLAEKIEDAGYRVRHLADLADVQKPLKNRMPGAIVVDVDFPEGSEAVTGLIAAFRAESGFRAPILFLAERNDMSARLDAVRAGSAAYFNKPTDLEDVLATLRELLLPQTSESYHRVLIINDRPTEAWEIAAALERKNIVPRVLIQPLQVLQEVQRFRPDLLLIDLDIKEVGGSEMVRVIAQHQDSETLPIILLSSMSDTDTAQFLSDLDAPGASVLSKSVPIDHLCWEVKQRLRRARGLRVKIGALTDNDTVSGLYNRRRFLMLLEQSLESLSLRTQSQAILFISLDNVRAIRDQSGVGIADEVIRQAASRLRRTLTHEQSAARFSDAVFTIMVPNLLGEALITLARCVRDTLETGFYQSSDQALLLRTSIGIATATDRRQGHLMLIQRADSACSVARESTGERIHLQVETTVAQQRAQAATRTGTGPVLEDIQELLEHQRLWLVFQPIASMRGDTNERYEVLVRMRDRDGQDITPGSVFSLIENHELGLAIDRWVVAHAIEMLKPRRQKTTLFIKVLLVSIKDKTFSAWVRDELEKAGVLGRRIVFEVAESSTERNVRDMFAFLSGIKMLGCGFCLDRFGRGADSLALLKNLGADYVKLDMHFVSNLSRDINKQAQLKELVQNLTTLGTSAIVGGVEDVKAMPVLWSLGVDLIQGFFLQQPYREMSYDFSGTAF